MKSVLRGFAAIIAVFTIMTSTARIAVAFADAEDTTVWVEDNQNDNYVYSELIEMSSSEETTEEIQTTEQATMEAIMQNIVATIAETTTEQTTAERTTEQTTAERTTKQTTAERTTKQTTAQKTTAASRTRKSDSIEKYLECPESLSYYMSRNSEVYAYIYLPGTGISYPVMRSRTNDLFYLDNDWRGNADGYGSIFTQSHNSKNFSDPVTLVYGHNFGNGKMFSNLHNYKNRAFFEENDLIVIYTPSKTFVYKIFSAFTFDDRHIMNSYDFSNAGDLADYQRTLTKTGSNKNVAEDVTIGRNSKIVTLSTCGQPYRGCDTRYLVSGVLIETVAN